MPHAEFPALSGKPAAMPCSSLLGLTSPHPKHCFLSVLPPHFLLTSATFAPPWATPWDTSAAFSQQLWLSLGVELMSLAKLGKLSFVPYLRDSLLECNPQAGKHCLKQQCIRSIFLSLSLKCKEIPKLFEMMFRRKMGEIKLT